MTEEQIQRYARHILLPDVGGRGQARLLAGSISIDVAAGAATEVALAYLAAAGVGRLVLRGATADAVTAADVADGLLLGVGDLGRPRGAALADRLVALNPEVVVDEDDGPTALELQALPIGGDLADALVVGGRAAAQAVAALVQGPA